LLPPTLYNFLFGSKVKFFTNNKDKKVNFYIMNPIRRYILETKVYYSSHGQAYTLKDFISIEVHDRGNYTMAEVGLWKRKYNLRDTTPCIWVTSSFRRTHRYAGYKLDRREAITYTSPRDGFIIPESDDGDEGYLFILK
jgi:hypothetical protein